MKSRLRRIVLVASIPLPMALKRQVLRRLLGWRIGNGVRIGLSYIDARNVDLADGVRIGHFNVVRNLPRLKMGHKATIGQWNWLTCAEMFAGVKRADEADLPGLEMDDYAALTSRHYLDCGSSVSIGSHTTVAGVRSTFLTHQIDTVYSHQIVKPIRIGSYCFVGSDVRMTPGSAIPDRCVIAMGAVVASALEEPGMLYGGVPARALKPVEGAYFERAEGRVGSGVSQVA